MSLDRILLDPFAENVAKPGFIEVDDELALLKRLTSDGMVLVRGNSLCNWAAEVAQARGWHVRWLSAPSSELRQLCTGLNEEQARTFISRIGDLAKVSRPLSLLNLGITRWPEIDPVGKSDSEQALSWVLWRIHVGLAPDEMEIVKVLASAYLSAESMEFREVFSASSAEEAWAMLKKWLHCVSSTTSFPLCPTELLPIWVQSKLEDEWKLAAVQTGGLFFAELVDLGAPTMLLKCAAKITVAYFRNNHDHLGQEILRAVRPYITFQDWRGLKSILPPTDPGSPPKSLPELFSWFTDQYLEYRLRTSRTPVQLDRVRQIALEFGLWYLEFYSNARTGGPGCALMSWSKTAELMREQDAVNLLVVLDGLGYIDAKQLIEYISSEATRLALDSLEVLLAPLPTVTHFAKPALLAGVTPAQAFEEVETASVETRDLDVISSLNASRPGNLIIWSLLEPDKTYHKPLDTQTLHHEVRGRLQSISQRVLRIVDEVDGNHRLRVYITTDHGRLLSSSQRACAVPANMKAHGRAAWGSGSFPFDRNGIYVEGAIAYIDPSRFGLPETAAMILSDEAFVTIDGRRGVASFPHGGVYPEEVLIPWIQFTRDRGPITLSINITGSGVAGASGKLRMQVINTSYVAIEILQIVILPVNLRIATQFTLLPFKAAAEEWAVADWPEKRALSNLRAMVTYALPTGERQTIESTPSLTTDEMYSRDDILGDLL